MDKIDRLINRVISLLDLVCSVVLLWLVLTLVPVVVDMLVFVKTWQGGW